MVVTSFRVSRTSTLSTAEGLARRPGGESQLSLRSALETCNLELATSVALRLVLQLVVSESRATLAIAMPSALTSRRLGQTVAHRDNRRTKQAQSRACTSYALQGGGKPKVNQHCEGSRRCVVSHSSAGLSPYANRRQTERKRARSICRGAKEEGDSQSFTSS